MEGIEVKQKLMLRFDVELDDDDMKSLEMICKVCHRSRKNFGESLVMLTIQALKKGSNQVDLSGLGYIKRATE